MIPLKTIKAANKATQEALPKLKEPIREDQQTKPSEKINLHVSFQGTGQHEGKSLKELFEMYPGARC